MSRFGLLSQDGNDETDQKQRDGGIEHHLSMVSLDDNDQEKEHTADLEQTMRVCPLFSSAALKALHTTGYDEARSLRQYSLLGLQTAILDNNAEHKLNTSAEDGLVYANMDAPWSAFVCGSQGAGKSHTLSCLLENALLTRTNIGLNPRPLTGMVFHYDKHSANAASQLCESAFLCSQGIPVQILVSPTSYWRMKLIYENMPNLPAGCSRPTVIPLLFGESQLDVGSLKSLMSVNVDNAHPPLYLATLNKILKTMAIDNENQSGINYSQFKRHLESQSFTEAQLAPLRLRLELLESFLTTTAPSRIPRAKITFTPGSLTIVDLSCPFVEDRDACMLFSICLSLFLEGRNEGGRIVALDEAHKFLTDSGEASSFTEELIQIICQQRHLATRVLIATQEPTLSTRLLDLCNVTIVHRFLSPAWFTTLRHHLAGLASQGGGKSDDEDIFENIVKLRTGEALVFSPTSLLRLKEGLSADEDMMPITLDNAYIKLHIRKRLTVDGGQSIMASDTA